MRSVIAVLLLSLACVAAQTALTSGVTMSVFAPMNCGWTHFTLPYSAANQIAGVSISFTRGFNAAEAAIAYVRIGSAPTFVDYLGDSCMSMGASCEFILPCSSAATDVLHVGVYSSFFTTENITITATIMGTVQSSPVYSLTDGMPVNISVRSGGESFFHYTIPATSNNTGILRLRLQSLDVTPSGAMLISELPTGMSRQCTTDFSMVRAIGQWTSQTDYTFDVSACYWMMDASAGVFSFAISHGAAAFSGQLQNFTITAWLVQGTAVRPIPDYNVKTDLDQLTYHDGTAPAAAEMVAVAVNGLEGGAENNNLIVNLNHTAHWQNEVSIGFPFNVGFDESSSCQPDYSAVRCIYSQCLLQLSHLQLMEEGALGQMWGARLDFTSGNVMTQINAYPISYGIEFISVPSTPTWLTINTPMAAKHQFGHDYTHFAVAVTQADIDAQSTLLVSLYQDNEFLSHNLVVFINPYGLAGQPEQGYSYHTRCQPLLRRGTCTAIVESCFLGVGTWYISVMAYDTQERLPQFPEFSTTSSEQTVSTSSPSSDTFSLFRAGWAEQDVPFTLTAWFETPTPLYNDTMVVANIPTSLQNTYHRQFMFTVDASVTSVLGSVQINIASLEDNFFPDGGSYSIQRGSPAGNGRSLCTSSMNPHLTGTFDLRSSVRVNPIYYLPAGTYYLGININPYSTSTATSPISVTATFLPFGGLQASTALTSGVAMQDMLEQNVGRQYTIDARGAKAGDYLEFDIEILTQNGGLFVYVLNDTVSYRLAAECNMGSGRNYYHCLTTIPACTMDQTVYYVYAQAISSTTTHFSLTATLKSAAAMPLTAGTPVVTTMAWAGARQDYSIAIPADLKGTTNLEISIYASRSDYFAAQISTRANNLASSSEACAIGSVSHGSLSGQKTSVNLQFGACDLPIGGYLFLAIETDNDLNYNREPVMFTVNATWEDPTWLTLGVGRRDVLLRSQVEGRTLSRHYAVALPATLTNGATVEFRLSSIASDELDDRQGHTSTGSSHAYTNFVMYATNSVDRPNQLAGASFFTYGVSVQSSGYVDRSTECCRSTYPDYARVQVTAVEGSNPSDIPFGVITMQSQHVHPGATYYIAVSGTLRAEQSPDPFVISAYIKEPASVMSVTNGQMVNGNANRWNPAIYTLNAPTADADSHWTVTVMRDTTVMTSHPARVYINIGPHMANEHEAVATCEFGLSPDGCQVQLPNCQGYTDVSVAIYAAPTLADVVNTFFTVSITHNPVMTITANTETAVMTLAQTGNTPMGWLQPAVYFKIDTSALGMLPSFDVSSKLYDWLDTCSLQVVTDTGCGQFSGSSFSLANNTALLYSNIAQGSCKRDNKWFYFAVAADVPYSVPETLRFTLTITNVHTASILTGSSATIYAEKMGTVNIQILSYTVPAGLAMRGSAVHLTLSGINNTVYMLTWRNGALCDGATTLVPGNEGTYTIFGPNDFDSLCEFDISGSTYYAAFMTSGNPAQVTASFSSTGVTPLTLNTATSGLINPRDKVALQYTLPTTGLTDRDAFSVSITQYPNPADSTVTTAFCYNSPLSFVFNTTTISSPNDLISAKDAMPTLSVVLGNDNSMQGDYQVLVRQHTYTAVDGVASGMMASYTPTFPGNFHTFNVPADTNLHLNITRANQGTGNMFGRLVGSNGVVAAMFSINVGQNMIIDSAESSSGVSSSATGSSSTSSSYVQLDRCAPREPVTWTLQMFVSSDATNAMYTVGALYNAPTEATVGTMNNFVVPAYVNSFSFFVPVDSVMASDLEFTINSTMGTNLLVQYAVDHSPVGNCEISADWATPTYNQKGWGCVGSLTLERGYFFTVSTQAHLEFDVPFTFMASTNKALVYADNNVTTASRTLKKGEREIVRFDTPRGRGASIVFHFTLSCGSLNFNILNDLAPLSSPTRCNSPSSLDLRSDGATINADGMTEVSVTWNSCGSDHPSYLMAIGLENVMDMDVSYTVRAEYAWLVPVEIGIGAPVHTGDKPMSFVLRTPVSLYRSLKIWTDQSRTLVNYADVTGFSETYECTGGSVTPNTWYDLDPYTDGDIYFYADVETTFLLSDDRYSPAHVEIGAFDTEYTNYFPVPNNRQPTKLSFYAPVQDRVEYMGVNYYSVDVSQYDGAMYLVKISGAQHALRVQIVSDDEDNTLSGSNVNAFDNNIQFQETNNYHSSAQNFPDTILPTAGEGDLTILVPGFQLNQERGSFLIAVWEVTNMPVDFTIQVDALQLPSDEQAATNDVMTLATPTETNPEVTVCTTMDYTDVHAYSMVLPTIAANQHLRVSLRLVDDERQNWDTEFTYSPNFGTGDGRGLVSLVAMRDLQYFTTCNQGHGPVSDCAFVVNPQYYADDSESPYPAVAKRLHLLVSGYHSPMKKYSLTVTLHTYDVVELAAGVPQLFPLIEDSATTEYATYASVEMSSGMPRTMPFRFTFTLDASTVNFELNAALIGARGLVSVETAFGFAPEQLLGRVDGDASVTEHISVVPAHTGSTTISSSYDGNDGIAVRAGQYGGMVRIEAMETPGPWTLQLTLKTFEGTFTPLTLDAAAVRGLTDSEDMSFYDFTLPDNGATITVTGDGATSIFVSTDYWSARREYPASSDGVVTVPIPTSQDFFGPGPRPAVPGAHVMIQVVSDYAQQPFHIAVATGVPADPTPTIMANTPTTCVLRSRDGGCPYVLYLTEADVGSAVYVTTDEAPAFGVSIRVTYGLGANVDFVYEGMKAIAVYVEVGSGNVAALSRYNYSVTFTVHVVAPVALTDGMVNTVTLPGWGMAVFSFPANLAFQLAVTQDFPTAFTVVERNAWFVESTQMYGYGVGARVHNRLVLGQRSSSGNMYLHVKFPSTPTEEAPQTIASPGFVYTDEVNPMFNTTVTFTAYAGGATLAKSIQSNLCGARNYVSPPKFGAEDAAVFRFESMYRRMACQRPYSEEAQIICQPLTAACNASLREYACMSTYREEYDGFVVEPCSSVCANVMRDCAPLHTRHDMIRTDLTGFVLGYGTPGTNPPHLELSWCAASSDTQCGGGARPVTPAAITAPPAAPAGPNVGLIVGVVLGVFFFLVIVAAIVFLALRIRKKNKIAAGNKINVEKKDTEKGAAPAPTSTPEVKPLNPLIPTGGN